MSSIWNALRIGGLILVLSEISCRIVLASLFQCPFLQTGDAIFHFYPELQEVQKFETAENKIRLLVLGGSVVYEDSLTMPWEGRQLTTGFCGMESLLSQHEFQVLNLAIPGHNSLDSKNKYEYIDKTMFDYVFVYHGINDTRVNNIDAQHFDSSYHHIEFYDDLAVLERHAEISIVCLPFMMDWLAHSIKKSKKKYIPKEIFKGLLSGNPESFLEHGSDIKSEATFRQHLTKIIKMATERQEQVVLSTFAWYMPENYTIERFKKGELDYDQQVFQTELYGLPDNVVAGLKVHNEVVKELHQQYAQTLFFDLNDSLIKSSRHFNDICHLNITGCNAMAEQLLDVIIESPH